MFRPSKEKARRLIPLGIVTHLGAIPALPQWSLQVAQKVAAQIIELTHVKTALHSRQLCEKTLLVCQRPVRLVGKALERAQGDPDLLQSFVKRRRDQLKEAQTTQDQAQPLTHNELMTAFFSIKCPHCHRSRYPWKRFNLVQGASWKQIPCSTCDRNTSASKWKCECDLEWHFCQLHRPLGFKMMPSTRKL